MGYEDKFSLEYRLRMSIDELRHAVESLSGNFDILVESVKVIKDMLEAVQAERKK